MKVNIVLTGNALMIMIIEKIARLMENKFAREKILFYNVWIAILNMIVN